MLVDMAEIWRMLFAVGWIVVLLSWLVALECSVDFHTEEDPVDYWTV